MGTTKTAIQAGGCPLCFVVAIEGYTNLIHDGGGGATNAAAVTAWAATSYAAAIRGLHRPGTIEQSIEPFRPKIEANSTTFIIAPDASDTFATDVFTTDPAAGVVLQMNDADDILNPTTTTLTWSSTADAAESGVLYIGTERTPYASKTGSPTFTTVHTSGGSSTRGTPVPFANGNSGGNFARQHRTSRVAGGKVSYVYARDYPGRGFIGRYIGCWAHRVVDGVLDTKANAELIFAGRIADIQDNQDGTTSLVCEDVRGTVRNAVLLGDQFRARPPEGFQLVSGTWADGLYLEYHLHDNITDPDVDRFDSATWTVGTDTAAGNYTADEIIGEIQNWIVNTASLTDDVWLYRTADGRVKFRVASASGTWNSAYVKIIMSHTVAGALGFDVEEPTEGFTDASDSPVTFYGDGDPLPIYSGFKEQGSLASIAVAVTAPFQPAYGMAGPIISARYSSARDQPTAAATGTWIDQSGDLPEPWASWTTPNTSSGSWGFLRFGDYIYLAKDTAGDGSNFNLYSDPEIARLFGAATYVPQDNKNAHYLHYGEPVPEFTQVVLIHNTIDYILSRIFYSTGDSTYNHATYDAWDYQLSCDGGIPGDLLGTNFINSLTSLAAAGGDASMTLLLEKPTKLEKILLPELILRNAHLAIGYGSDSAGLVFVSPTTPTAANATHTITTSHRAAPAGQAPDVPAWEQSRNTLITHIKVNYNYDVNGKSRNTIEFSNEQTKTDYGGSEPITIEARNNIALTADEDAGASVRALVANLAGDALAYYNRPHPIASRAVAATKWFMTPSDSVTVTDDWLRDPTDGTRGISEVPGWIASVSQNWQTMIAEVGIIMHGDDSGRRVIYAPVATVDSTAGTDSGYTHTGPYIHLLERDFALSSESEDGASFEDGDLIRIVERSPATPGSPSTFDKTVSGSYDATNNRITLTAALPASNSLNGKKWYITSQLRSSAQSSQQADCYLGDDVDGRIEGDAYSRLWAHQAISKLGGEAAVQTDLHEYPPTDGNWHTEGRPVNPMMHRAAVYSVNNLIGYRAASEMPMAWDSSSPFTTTATDYVLALYPFLYYLGRGRSNVYTRAITLGPAMKQTTGGTGTLRITCSKVMPITADTGIGGALSVSFSGPITQRTFTNTSTTYANVTASTITPVVWPGGSYTWITVELKTSANTAGFYGFHTFKLGPLA